MVQKARDATRGLQDNLGDLRMGRSYEKAANLCELIATGQPKKEESREGPFENGGPSGCSVTPRLPGTFPPRG